MDKGTIHNSLFNYYSLHIVLREIEWHHSVKLTQTRSDVSEADPQRIKRNKIRGIKVDIRTRDEQMERIPAKPSAPSKTLQGTNALVLQYLTNVRQHDTSSSYKVCRAKFKGWALYASKAL